MRPAGKCGSRGRYTPPALKIGEDGGHPVQVALGHHRDDTFAAQPSRQQGSPEPVGTGVELPIGPLLGRRCSAAMASGCASTRCSNSSCTRRSGRSRQGPASPSSCEVELLGGKQALPAVLGIRIGGDQLQRRDVSSPAILAAHSASSTSVRYRSLSSGGRRRARCPPTARCPRNGLPSSPVGSSDESRTTVQVRSPGRASDHRPGSPCATALLTRPDGCLAAPSAMSGLPSSVCTATVGRPARAR